jgi:hypothetical protein
MKKAVNTSTGKSLYLYDYIKKYKEWPSATTTRSSLSAYGNMEAKLLHQAGKAKDCWAWYLKEFHQGYFEKNGKYLSFLELKKKIQLDSEDLDGIPMDWFYSIWQQHREGLPSRLYPECFALQWIEHMRKFAVGELPRINAQPNEHPRQMEIKYWRRWVLTYREWEFLLRRVPKAGLIGWVASNGKWSEKLPDTMAYLHPRFLRKVGGPSESRIINYLIIDTRRSASALGVTDEQLHSAIMPLYSITSKRHLKELHDALAERVLEKEEREARAHRYNYKQTLVSLINEMCPEYKLPAGQAELVGRGRQHHNCVASYASRHSSRNTSPAVGQGPRRTLLLLGPAVTCELRITANVSGCNVLIVQHRGAYNKEIAIPENLGRAVKRMSEELTLEDFMVEEVMDYGGDPR